MSEQSRNSLVTDSVFCFVAQVTSLVFGITTGIFLARTLGPELRGTLGMLLLLPYTALALLTGGLSPAVAYLTATNKWKDCVILPRVLGIAIWISVIGGVVMVVVLLVYSALYKALPLGLLIAATGIYFPTLFSTGVRGVLIGKQAFRNQMLAGVVSSLMQCLLIVVSMVVLDFSVLGAIVGHCAGALSAMVIHFVALRGVVESRSLKPEMRFRKLSDAFSYGGKSSAANALGFLNYRVDQFLLYGMCGSYTVGVYLLAVGVVEKLWMVASNLSTSWFPRVAASDAQSSDVTSKTARIAALLFLVMVPVGVVTGVLASFVPFVYGEEFSESVALVRWLLPGIVLLGQAKVFASFLAARGYPGLNAVASAVGLAVNVVLNICLIPTYGAVGAAIATTSSYAVITALYYWNFVRCSEANWLSPLVPRVSDLRMLVQKIRNLCVRVVFTALRWEAKV